jgi:hypothetical protein
MSRKGVLTAVLVGACFGAACNDSGQITAPTPTANPVAEAQQSGETIPPSVPVPPGPVPRDPAPGPVTPPQDPPTASTCDPTKAQWAVGEPAGADLLERARVAAGARTARFLGANEVVTLEYLGSRLNLVLDAQSKVRSATCG